MLAVWVVVRGGEPIQGISLGLSPALDQVLALLTIGAIIVFHRTRAHKFALVLGLVFAALLALIPIFGGVHLIGDIAEIPRGLPLPVLPDFSQILELIVPALSLAILAIIPLVAGVYLFRRRDIPA